MTFPASRSLMLAGLAAILAACGGSDDTPAPAAPAPTSSAPAPEAEPEPEAAPQAPTEEAASEPSAEFASLPAPYNEADYNRGRTVFRQCSACHLVQEGAGHRVGPNLHGMFSRNVGEAEGFNYSDALLEADFEWTPEQLESWLENPRGFLPGNRMSFAGIRREDDRHAVIAYVMVESGWTPEAE